MTRRRAVITGIGPITPIGIGVRAFWDNLCAGVAGVGPVTRFDAAPFRVKNAGEVRDFDASRYLTSRQLRKVPLFAQYAAGSARLAIEDSGLPSTEWKQMGACFASSISGGSEAADREIPRFVGNGADGMNPLVASWFTPHFATSLVCEIFGMVGPKSTIAAGCTSGLDTVEWARERVVNGAAEAVVVGATDAPLSPYVFGVLAETGLYSQSPRCPRPFDQAHDGSAISEGGAALVVEELQHARLRGARIYAEIVSQVSLGEEGDFLRPATGIGAEQVLRKCLADSGCSPQGVDCVFPFATGVPAIDAGEVTAIKAVLGPRAHRIPIPSVYGSLGHMISASGLMQVVAAALSIHGQQVPPTAQLERVASGCDLDFVPFRSRRSRLINVVTLARSLSRTFAAVLLTRASDEIFG